MSLLLRSDRTSRPITNEQQPSNTFSLLTAVVIEHIPLKEGLLGGQISQIPLSDVKASIHSFPLSTIHLKAFQET